MLQRIKDGAKVELHPPQEAAGRLAPAARAVLGALPAQLAAHIVDTLGKDGELVVFMDSAVWAARLKLWLGEHSGELAGQRVTVRIRQQQRDKR